MFKFFLVMFFQPFILYVDALDHIFIPGHIVGMEDLDQIFITLLKRQRITDSLEEDRYFRMPAPGSSPP